MKSLASEPGLRCQRFGSVSSSETCFFLGRGREGQFCCCIPYDHQLLLRACVVKENFQLYEKSK